MGMKVLEGKAHPDPPNIELTVGKFQMCLQPLVSFEVPESEI